MVRPIARIVAQQLTISRRVSPGGFSPTDCNTTSQTSLNEPLGRFFDET